MNRKETTKFLSEKLIACRLSGNGKHWASEVTLDWGHGKGKEKRVDFMLFEPANQFTVAGIEKGIFTSFEIKSCMADYKSGNGLTFITEKNYIVMPMELYRKATIYGNPGAEFPSEFALQIPWDIGVMVPIPYNKTIHEEIENPTPLDADTQWNMEIVIPSKTKYREKSVTELLFNMLRSGR